MDTPQNEMADIYKKSKGMLMFLGILCVILGMLAIATPVFAGSMVTIIVGALMLTAGISEIVHSFQMQDHRVVTFLKGLLSLVAGGIIMARPLMGLTIFTLMLAIYFVIDGIMWCIMAFKLKPNSGWGMGLFNGIITFVLGGMIWRQWPVSAAWAIGVLVGIRIMMMGWTMLFFSSAAGAVAKELSE
jgi:uncharacterized membrane protein HdeD (DUF308 family)